MLWDMEFQFYKVFLAEHDYILINSFTNRLPEAEQMPVFLRQICNRHTGVGSMGVIILSKDAEHSAALNYFTAAGSEEAPSPEVLMCASRYAFDYGLAQKEEIVLQTAVGPRLLQCIDSSHFSFNMGNPATHDDRAITSTGTVDYQVSLETQNHSLRCIPVYFNNWIAAVYMSERQPRLNEQISLKRISHIPVYYRVLEKEELEFPSSLIEGTDVIEAAASVGVAAVVNGFCERDLVIKGPDDGSFFFEWNERSNTVFVTAKPQYAFAGTFTFNEDEYGPTF